MVNPAPEPDIVRLVLISVPPEPVLGELAALTAALAAVSGARVATAYPPHVTLRTGALVPRDRLEDFAHGFAAWCAATPACTIRTAGVLRLTSPAPFVGLAITADDDLLDRHRRLLAYAPWRKGLQPVFQPHLSLAYDDLAPEALPAVDAVLARWPLRPWSWRCDRVGCYSRSDGRWVPWREMALAPV